MTLKEFLDAYADELGRLADAMRALSQDMQAVARDELALARMAGVLTAEAAEDARQGRLPLAA